MSTTTVTTTKQRRPRITTGILITSTNTTKRKRLQFLDSLDVKVMTYFNPINYNISGYRFVNI